MPPQGSCIRTRSDDAAVYRQAILAVMPQMPREELSQGLTIMRPRTLARGEHLFVRGEHAADVVLVTSGLLRSYFLLPDGSERSTLFAPQGDFAASFAGLASAGPAPASVVAEEPTRALLARCTEYRQLLESSAMWMSFARLSAERWLKRKAEREYELLALDARARRAALSAQLPGIEARVAGRHIASYLGITSVHLSRLRRQQLDERTEARPARER